MKEVLIFVSLSLKVLAHFKWEKIKSIGFSTKQYTLNEHEEFYESYSYKTAKQLFQLCVNVLFASMLEMYLSQMYNCWN